MKGECEALWRREKKVLAARASEDPLVLCKLGWHQHERRGNPSTYFRWMGSGKIGERLNYRVGSSPLEWTATKIAALGPQAVPSRCSVCHADVPDELKLV